MACKYMTGFEHDLTILGADGVTVANTPVIGTTERHRTISGRGGDRSIQCNSSGDQVNLPAFSVGVAEEIVLAIHHSVGAAWTITFNNGSASENCSVRMAVDGFLRLQRASTVLATSALVLPSLTWTWLKLKITARDAAGGGRMIAYINGDTTPFADTGAGANCQNTASADFASVRLTAPSGTVYFDDYHQGGAGTFPDQALYIQTLRPNSDAGPNQGTPSAGATGFGVVDEDPVSTADYIEDTVTANENVFGFPALGFTPLEVFCVRTLCDMTGEGTITLARGKVRHSGTTTEGTDKAMQTGGLYGIIGDIFPLCPSTGLAWTGAEVDAIEAGYEVT